MSTRAVPSARRDRIRRRGTVVLAAAALAAASCTSDPSGASRSDPSPLRVEWQESAPLPRPGASRAAVRDLTRCGDHWLTVGTAYDGEQTSPAAWTSADGTVWSEVAVRGTSYYGRLAILLGVACRGEAPVAFGAKSGGAHGNARTMTFRPLASGSWLEVEEGAEMYGGPSAVNVGAIAAGPPGWLITGNRTSGPAVWTASSPRQFVLRDGLPGLADTPARALAQDGVWDAAAWTVVGGAAGEHLNGTPEAWRSPDGRRWTTEDVPDTEDYDELHAVAAAGDRLIAVGLHGDRFGSWVREDGEWRFGAAFGHRGGGGAASYAASLAAGPAGAFATTSDGTAHGLWFSPDGIEWRPVEIPLAPTITGDHTLVVTMHEDRVLLAADDGTGARIWTAGVP